jgi:hypothetical protein
MRSQTILIVRWKLTGRMEVFVNLGKLYTTYSSSSLGVSRYTFDRKNLFEGFQNEIVEILNAPVK